MFRARAAGTEHASIAKYELLEQSTEDMLQPRSCPRLNPTRNGGRTVAGRDQGRINLSISFGCDYCATTRRKRDVACWQFPTWPVQLMMSVPGEVGSQQTNAECVVMSTFRAKRDSGW